MNILLSPQVNDEQNIHYRFNGEIITVTIGADTDIFDFAGLPIGQVDGIETTLAIDPILSAERKEDGQMYVTLLNFITEDAPESDKFPSWKVV
jgi:hypothetical protein